VKEKYPVEGNPSEDCTSNTEILQNWLMAAKPGDNLKKVLVPKTSNFFYRLYFPKIHKF